MRCYVFFLLKLNMFLNLPLISVSSQGICFVIELLDLQRAASPETGGPYAFQYFGQNHTLSIAPLLTRPFLILVAFLKKVAVVAGHVMI